MVLSALHAQVPQCIWTTEVHNIDMLLFAVHVDPDIIGVLDILVQIVTRPIAQSHPYDGSPQPRYITRNKNGPETLSSQGIRSLRHTANP